MKSWQFAKAFHLAKFLFCFKQAGSRPAKGLITGVPAFHVARHSFHGGKARFDRIGIGSATPQQLAHAQPMYREGFFETFLQAMRRGRIHTFQLPED